MALPLHGVAKRRRADTGRCTQADTRQPHTVPVLVSRSVKAINKIDRPLDLPQGERPYRVLETGTNSGGITNNIATEVPGRYSAIVIDTIDQRLIHDSYKFIQIAGTTLPFPDGDFDLVTTNHMIEHVGDTQAQLNHLAEARRVMAADRVSCLDIPKPWTLVEPHYHLPFLCWRPLPWRTPYPRLIGKGEIYDCAPLIKPQRERILQSAGFSHEYLGTRALDFFLTLEQGPLSTRLP